MGWKNPHR